MLPKMPWPNDQNASYEAPGAGIRHGLWRWRGILDIHVGDVDDSPVPRRLNIASRVCGVRRLLHELVRNKV